MLCFSFINLNNLNFYLKSDTKRVMDTTLDISSDVSTSHGGAGGFWKKPAANSVSWDDLPSVEENGPFSALSSCSKSRVGINANFFEVCTVSASLHLLFYDIILDFI